MEIPVLTSASTHGLRSAVGACSKPSTSFLASNPFSGGCLKEIFTTVKKSGSGSCLKELNQAKKRKARSECEVRCKKEKYINGKACSGQALLANKYKNRRLERVREGKPSEGCGSPYASPVGVPAAFFTQVKSAVCEDSFNGEPSPGVSSAGNNASASCLTVATSGCGTASPLRDHVTNNEEHDPDSDGAYACSHDISISDVDDDSEDVNCESMNAYGKGGEESGRKLNREPKESIDRTPQISRDVGRAWNPGLDASSFAPQGPFPHAARELLVTPRASQVRETLKSAGREVSIEENGQLVAESGHIPTFCDTGIPRAAPSPEHFGKNGGSRHRDRRSSKSSKTMCKYDVFLGGSCNPTTWRTDIAIPDLKKMGITYYNPVSQWRPELLEVEYHAKENAAIMFFVIDNQTRGVSALIEVAHIAGSKKNLILVIQSYTEEKQTICGEEISQEEYEDLRNGQEVLQDLVESQGIPVFNNIRIALQRTEKLLGKGLSAEVETDAQEDSRVMQPTLKQIKMEEAFAAVATSEDGKIALKDAYLAYQLLTQKSISLEHVKYAADMFGMEEEEAIVAERILNFEEFQSLVAAFGAKEESKELIQDPSHPLLSEDVGESCSSYMRDVYLGGTRKDTSWKNDIAIPMLKENGLTYFNPSISEWSERFSPIEASSINFSYILLFVITNSARSIAEMAVAGHYIGLGARMVLCIQQLPDELTLGQDKLTENAIKDYNRGRIYLADIAKRNGVEIFRSIPEAVAYCVAECKKRRNPSN